LLFGLLLNNLSIYGNCELAFDSKDSFEKKQDPQSYTEKVVDANILNSKAKDFVKKFGFPSNLSDLCQF